MGDFDRLFADALIAAFLAGGAAVGVLWLLWHFVFSHISLGWS